MANGEFLEVISPKALADLQKVNDELVKTIANVKEVNSNMIGLKTPSGSDSAIKDLNNKLIQQEKLYTELQIKLERYAQAQNRTKISTNALEQSNIRLEASIERKNKALERENAKLEASQSLYNKVQQKLNSLSNEYKNLAVKKELSGKLTNDEAKRYDYLSSRIQKYDTTLKAVDASMGKYQRNVGNYASGYNALGNSVNQLTREMPAFANSVNTGFMAISNNLPIFFDAISQTNAELKALKAQGQEVPSLFSKLASSVFTWGTALSVGVTLLTVFGGQIVNYIFNTDKAKKATEAHKKAIEDKIEAEKAQNNEIGQSIAVEQNRSRILFEIAKNQEVSDKKRKEALDELRSRYGKYLQDLTDQEILAGKTAEAEERLNIALIGRGYAMASQNLLEKNATAQMALQVEYQKQIAVSFERLSKLRNEDGSIKNMTEYNKVIRESAVANGIAYNELNKKLKPLKEEENVLLNLFKVNAKYLDAIDDGNDKTKKSTKSTKEKTEAIKLEAEKMDTLLGKLEEQIKYLKEIQQTSENNTEWTYWQKGIDGVQKYIDWIKNGSSELKDSAQKATDELEKFWGKRAKAQVEEMAKATRDWINSFNTSFLSENGLGGLDMFFRTAENGRTVFQNLYDDAQKVGEGWKVAFLGMSQVAEESFALIDQFSQQNYENEYARLQQQKDVAILFAGDSVSGQEEINQQYDERRRKIARQEAEEKKRTATFKAIIDTAQAVVSALPNIPLSIAVGVIGAAQIALIQSQQVPAFAKGTDNAPEGWALTQEKGAEIITDKSGKVKSMGNNKGAQYTYLNKGDKVFTAEQSEAIMFNKQLNGILAGNGIGASIINMNDNSDVVSSIESLKETINSKPSLIIQQDERGRRVYERKQANTRQLMNNHLTYKGYDI